MLKAVVCDVDGVLVDTEGLQYQIWLKVLKPFGKDLQKSEYIRDFSGKTREEMASLLVKGGLDISPEELARRCHLAAAEFYKNRKLEPIPHVLESLEFFRNKGIALAVASSPRREEVEAKLKSSGLLEKFQVIATGSEVQRQKPHPDLYLFTTQMLGCHPGECAAIEDTSSGVAAGKSAGMLCIAIPNEYSRSQNFSMADFVATDMKGAMKFLSRKFCF